MIFIKKDAQFIDEFEVLDDDNNPVTGLVDGDFTHNLYNPSKNEVSNISGGVPVVIEEVGSGLYRVNFTPNAFGNWVLVVYHTTHFPWGKGDNYVCVNALCNDLEELIRRILGLSQENYRIFNPTYNGRGELLTGTIKIYSSASDVDTDTNAIAQYAISAVYNAQNRMTSYKVKRTA